MQESNVIAIFSSDDGEHNCHYCNERLLLTLSVILKAIAYIIPNRIYNKIVNRDWFSPRLFVT